MGFTTSCLLLQERVCWIDGKSPTSSSVGRVRDLVPHGALLRDLRQRRMPCEGTLPVVPHRFYRRRWDETRGDEFDSWGRSVWYFEVGDDGWPLRQVEVYDVGRVLRYGPERGDNRYGGLSQASLYDSDEDWSGFEISEVEFERAWGWGGE